MYTCIHAFKCLQLNTIPNPRNLSDVEMLWMAGLLVQWTIPNIHKDVIGTDQKFALKITVVDMGGNHLFL